MNISNFLSNSSYIKYKKECIERYVNGCSIRGESPLLSEYIRIIFNKDVEIPFFDINVNNRCTLKCKKCDQGIPYLNNKEIYSADDVINNLKKLFQYVDYVYQVSILGGEPFINRDLASIIKFCSESEKIGSCIVVTNGTIFPDEEVLKALKSNKIVVGISWYPLKNEDNRIKLLEYFERNGINHHIRRDNWLDFGDFRISRFYSKKKLKKVYEKCFLNKCVQFNEGKLYRCTKVRLLEDQNICKHNNDEIIEVDKIKSKKDAQRKIKRFYSRKYLLACNYCNSDEKLKWIPLGEQLQD